MENKIDLTGIHLLIATPSHDGKYESCYMDSLVETEKLIKEYGGQVGHIKINYCADIYYARARLAGAFYRAEKTTHMIMIDADMGWNAHDIVRMLLLRSDLIGAAGPRKQYPLNAIRNYAFALRDDYGNYMPFYHTLETNVGEVSEVGGAFLMISRACIEKMVNAHPELEFETDENTTDYALFEPIIINKGKEYTRRRLSEDYAFCYRWRQLGGKVEVLLDVKLKHVGGHCFEGQLLDALINEAGDFVKNTQ